jgi:hypothetical protein
VTCTLRSVVNIAAMAVAASVIVLSSGCEACGSCIGQAISDRVIAQSDAGPATVACPIPLDKQALVGVWRNERVAFKLAVASDCRVSYERDGTKVSAPLMQFYGDDFSVGMLGIGTTFKVTAPPKVDVSGVMRMTVDGVELTKTDESPAAVIDASTLRNDND